MFTGIIESVGKVKYIEKRGPFGKIAVDTEISIEGVVLGDSISVEGVCLTVTGFLNKGFIADISAETLNVTTLGELKPGSPVNLERALTLSKPLGGHLVTGHIDGIGTIKKKDGETLEIEVPKGLLVQVVKKGSIAVDGISLTVATLTDSGFSVAVIPLTLANTTLSSKSSGAKVNIETDLIGKYVQKYMDGTKGGNTITEGFLAEHGFFGRKGF